MSKTKAQELKIYEVSNQDTGQKLYKAATSPTDACKQAGWKIGDCYVFQQKPRSFHVPDHDPILKVKISCCTCPFQFAECTKPASEDCPTRPSSPELQNWLKQAAESHLCGHIGESLTKTDYNLGQKWVPMEQAIEELARTS